MEIRPYDDADEPAVIALWRAVFDYDAPHNDPATAVRRKTRCQRELFYVAALDGTVVGTIMGGYDGHRGWLYALAVDPSARRRGIGTALVRHLERALAERDCPKVNLQIFADNAGVVAFYESLGYKVEQRVSMGKLLA